jgi:cytochrome c
VLPAADVAAGQATFAKCQSCHSLTANGTGPNLTGVVGRRPGTEPGFAYSDPMKAFGAKQAVWDYDHIYEFIKGPAAYIPGTKMTFVGLKAPQDRINVIAYLRGQGGTLPIPAPKPAAAAAPAAGDATPGTAPPTPGAAPTAAGAATPASGAPKPAEAGKPTATGTTATPSANPGGPAPTGPSGPKQDSKSHGNPPTRQP